MHRIDTSTAQKDKFGAGKNGFTSGNPQTGTPATEVSAEIFDAMQEEIAAVIEDPDSGASLDKSKNNQLVTALKAIIRSIGMTASETVRGVLKVATQPQTNAGTADDVAVTPKKLRGGVTFSDAGFLRLPAWMGGYVLQWGFVSVSANTGVITYPVALTNSPYFMGASNVYGSAISAVVTFGYNVSSPTSVTWYSTQSFSAGGTGFGWFLIGKAA